MSNAALAKLKALVAARSAQMKAAQDGQALNIPPEGNRSTVPTQVPSGQTELAARLSRIVYNKEQQTFIDTVLSGVPCSLIGPAGTGKTTCTKGAIEQLLASGKIPGLNFGISSHKHLSDGAPGIVCVSFTNKAVQNIKKVLSHDMQHNCITIHKLLEFEPEYFDVYDPTKGEYKKSMRFIPTRNANRKLPDTLKVLVIDESSMVGVDLWNMLYAALPPGIQIILIGDIQQLPPVFGKSIFIHALQAGIKRVELVEVYRQAMESPIIKLATMIRQGVMVKAPELDSWNIDKMESGNGKLTIRPWKKAFGADAAMVIMSKWIPERIEAGEYDPLEDTILTPYNKAFGTIELNKIVASYRAKYMNPEQEPVYEVMAGIQKKYFRVGDKVLWNKTEHIITDIKKNPAYFGRPVRAASVTLDYDGIEHDEAKSSALAALLSADEIDAEAQSVDDFLNSMAMNFDNKEEEGKLTRAASHKITVYSEEFGAEETLESAGDLNALDLGYALTVHKSQGSEYRRVFFITHASQSNMFFRELIYTGITRAKEELYIVCPPNLLVAGVTSQRLPGKNLDDKIAAFDKYVSMQKLAKDEIPVGLSIFASGGSFY